jgi:hypothetical protein
VKLADASEALAEAVRPKKRRRRVRRALVVVLLGGGAVALVRSPLRAKLTDRLFGTPSEFEDDAPDSITLPRSSATGDTSLRDGGEADLPADTEENAGGDSNGVVSSSVQAGGESATS